MKTAPTNIANPRFRAFICLAISTGLILVGLWPFNFFPDNNVRWLTDSDGLRFDRYGMACVREPVFVPGGTIDLTKGWTVYLEARPLDEPSDSLPRLLSIHDNDGRELFLIGQWRSGLVIRTLEDERHFRLKYRETGVGNFRRDTKRTFAVHCDNTGVAVYAEGRSVPSRIGGPHLLLSKNRAPAYLIIGNSPTGEHPWRGDILSLSLLGKESIISYRFSEGRGSICRSDSGSGHDLVIPAVFRAPKKGILVPTWKVQQFNRSFWKDVIVNVLGFIPFGFAVSARLWRGDGKTRLLSTATAVLLGGGISLAIELLQVYLPTRDSSLTDVINNVLGTWIGVLLFRAARRILYR